jgi:hypothetical protein
MCDQARIELLEKAETIMFPAVGKVAITTWRMMVNDIVNTLSFYEQQAYENAATIAENCTQDDAARDEPFRIAMTLRAHAKRLTGTE